MKTNNVVIGIVYYEENILTGKKKETPGKWFSKKWHLPGETVEDGETDEQALVRGMQEEADLEITVGKYVASDRTPTGKNVRWYECFASTDSIRAGSDLEEVKWIKKDGFADTCPYVLEWFPNEMKKYFGLNT